MYTILTLTSLEQPPQAEAPHRPEAAKALSPFDGLRTPPDGLVEEVEAALSLAHLSPRALARFFYGVLLQADPDADLDEERRPEPVEG